MDTVEPQQASKLRKCGVELFEFNLPTFTTPYVDLMITNTPEAKRTLQMVKNANKKAIKKGSDKIFNQGSSKGIMAAWGKQMAAAIGVLNPQRYTGHCWRRTGATCLAEEGISEISLKRAGQ